MSRLSFALTIAALFGAIVVLIALALRIQVVSDSGNEDFAHTTDERTQVTQTPEETTALEETTSFNQAPPETTLSYGGREVRSSAAPSYCWVSGCVDGLPRAPSRHKTLTVPSGSQMVFHYESQSPPNKVTATAARPYEGQSPYKLTQGPKRSLEIHGSGVERAITAGLPPGEYLVFVHITAPEGEVSYIFRVVVQ